MAAREVNFVVIYACGWQIVKLILLLFMHVDDSSWKSILLLSMHVDGRLCRPMQEFCMKNGSRRMPS